MKHETIYGIKKALLLFLALGLSFADEVMAGGGDYTFSCWLNGWRKNVNDSSADLFGIETCRYGFVLDVDNFKHVQFGPLKNPGGYEKALEQTGENLSNLPRATLLIELNVDGVRYRANTCKAGTDTGVKRLAHARLWESGRYVQHFDFVGLDFRNAKGEKLPWDATLDIVAWPAALTFSLDVTASAEVKNAAMSISMISQTGQWKQAKKIEGPWKKDTAQSISMTCDVSSKATVPQGTVTVTAQDGQAIPVVYDKRKNCHVASVKHLKREWKTGYTDIRDYDEFKINIKSSGQKEAIPFLLDLRSPANITGLCPILCDEDGRPTGIPVQLSKNWHYRPMGNYLMAYTLLPAQTKQTYMLRIVYGFYGKLPAASHAQLSLVGYGKDINGNNGRWDQLAIGCWGETICFDMDTSCVDMMITDIRMLMARDGVNGKKWQWTDAGWGGDWLNIQDQAQKKYFQNNVKTAYLSHGPCLTDVRHSGCYGMNREIDFKAKIQTLRTDDYARTFQKFDYEFTRDVSANNLSLFKLGRTHRYRTPTLAYGNRDGLIEEHTVPNDLKTNRLFLDTTELSGPGPWWIALPGAIHTTDKEWGTGYRALIIRDYHVLANQKTYTHPTIRIPVLKSNPNNLEIELLAPNGMINFKKGDRIRLDLELITLHRCADDYYGPNEAYRKHLIENPNSWKTTHREAKSNDLKVAAIGGKVVNHYPIIIQADKPDVTVTIEGGVGAAPICFKGLKSIAGYQLYQLTDGRHIPLDGAVHGNDNWQTDFDASTDSYSISFNLPLDNLNKSTWLFSPKPL